MCRSVDEAHPVTEGRGHSNGPRRSSSTEKKHSATGGVYGPLWLRLERTSEGMA